MSTKYKETRKPKLYEVYNWSPSDVREILSGLTETESGAVKFIKRSDGSERLINYKLGVKPEKYKDEISKEEYIEILVDKFHKYVNSGYENKTFDLKDKVNGEVIFSFNYWKAKDNQEDLVVAVMPEIISTSPFASTSDNLYVIVQKKMIGIVDVTKQMTCSSTVVVTNKSRIADYVHAAKRDIKNNYKNKYIFNSCDYVKKVINTNAKEFCSGDLDKDLHVLFNFYGFGLFAGGEKRYRIFEMTDKHKDLKEQDKRTNILRVYDIDARNEEGGKGGYKSIPLDNVQEAVVSGIKYKFI